MVASRLPRALLVAVIAVVYFAAAKLGLSLAFYAEQVSVVWPPTGIALAAVVLWSYRVWPGIAAGAFLANITADEPAAVAAGIAVGNTLEAVIGGWLLARVVEFRPALARLQDAGGLILLAAIGSTMISATIGASSLCLGGVHPWSNFDHLWGVWWLGDAVGAIVVAPLILTWATASRHALSAAIRPEAMGLLLGSIVVSSIVFLNRTTTVTEYTLVYTVFPVAIWAALRFGPPVTSIVTFVVSGIAIWATASGLGPFTRGNSHESLILLQSFIGMLAGTSLLLAAAISERSQVALSLRESHNLLSAVTEGVTDAVFVKDRGGRYLMINSAGAAFLGKRVEEVIGQDDRSLFSPETAQTIMDWDRWIMDSQETQTREEVGTAAGVTRTYLSTKGPFFDHSGNVVGLIGIAIDITERKNAERQLKKLNETLEQRVADRTAIADLRAAQSRELALELARVEQRERRRLAAILHDHLQQLLVAAKMRIGLVSSRLQDGAGRSLREAEDLLAESIDASRSLAIELSPPILRDAGLNAALQWLARWMDENHELQVELRTAIPHDLELENEDIKAFVFEAVRELLFNVVKHSGTRQSRILLDVFNGDFLRITVEDEGHGFDPARLDGARLDGFGLFSIRERLELHNGRFELTTAPGRGTRIRLVVPTRPAELPPSAEPAVLETASAAAFEARLVGGGNERQDGCIHVLLADDHAIVRKGLKGLLEAEPEFQVIGEAADGMEAIEQTRQLRPDVVVMDINMPRVNGLESTRQIKREFPEVIVIGLSLHDDTAMATAMTSAGASAYVTKGGPPEDLCRAIRVAAIGRAAAFAVDGVEVRGPAA